MLRFARGLLRASGRRLTAKYSGYHEGVDHEGPQMMSGGTVNHIDTPDNTPRVPFDFSEQSYTEIDKIFAKYPSRRRSSGVIPLLHLVQCQTGGWIPVSAMDKVAKICEVPSMRVYEVASFYSMFNRQPIGKYLLQVCITTPCQIMGADDVAHALEHHLGVDMGGTTADGLFSLGEMECMGCCVNAPMMVVSDFSRAPDISKFAYDFYEDLTTATAIEIVELIRAGKRPPPGPYKSGRVNSAPKAGRTTLKEIPDARKFCRDLSKC